MTVNIKKPYPHYQSLSVGQFDHANHETKYNKHQAIVIKKIMLCHVAPTTLFIQSAKINCDMNNINGIIGNPTNRIIPYPTKIPTMAMPPIVAITSSFKLVESLATRQAQPSTTRAMVQSPASAPPAPSTTPASSTSLTTQVRPP